MRWFADNNVFHKAVHLAMSALTWDEGFLWLHILWPWCLWGQQYAPSLTALWWLGAAWLQAETLETYMVRQCISQILNMQVQLLTHFPEGCRKPKHSAIKAAAAAVLVRAVFPSLQCMEPSHSFLYQLFCSVIEWQEYIQLFTYTVIHTCHADKIHNKLLLRHFWLLFSLMVHK